MASSDTTAVTNKGAADRPPSQPAGDNPRSTHFIFEHSVFQFPEARFCLATDGTPSLVMLLGEIDITMSIKSMRTEFKLDGSWDGQLLDMIVAGLHFVRIIRPGDSIPREILDGTASWTIEERHHEIARGRITWQISTWLSGEEKVISDQQSLLQLAEDPATKARVQAAFTDIAARLGLGAEGKQEVITRIETVTRELAYIEALRERYGVISLIKKKIADFRICYRHDRTMEEEILRSQSLMRKPFGEIEAVFDHLDGQCGEIVSLLRNITSQIEFIRKGRDDLHERMMLWDDIVIEWQSPTIERSLANEALLRNLYRFLARNFNIQKAWQLTTSKS